MIRRLKIVVPSFNSIDYLPKTLGSIESQTRKDVDVCVIDDGSTLPEQRSIIESFCNRNGWNFLFFDKNMGALHGMVHAIQKLNCQDGDVIAVVDGDDWLADEKVFDYLYKLYGSEDLYLTWGQCATWPYIHHPSKYAHTIAEKVITEKLYREIPFVFWHLGTFKYDLWRRIRDEDLRDSDGSYLRLMKDKATLYPMLEMAGRKIRFVSDVLYIYNIDNPLNDYACTPPEEFARVDLLVRSRAKYNTIPECAQ